MLSRVWLCGLFLFPMLVVAQSPQEVCRWIKPSEGTQLLDSLSVHPPSLRLAGADSLPGFEYQLASGVLRFKEGNWPDSVQFCYQQLPYALHHTYQNRSLAAYDSNALYEYPLRNLAEKQLKEELFATDSLQKSGSLSRGISFGNRQNVFVQSSLNLQLDGKLSDKINIRASISDQDVPFQPEGNTQHLQEFDKVFIELYDESSSLAAGDLVLRPQQGYFMQYLKNVQGIQLATKRPLLGLGPSTTEADLALAKGKFASVNLQPIEGLQGPYKLPGPAGQAYVMVLSNSEKVYLDGRLLKRGFNYDYTIDYNLGELSFSPGIIISPYSRIRIDYEYADQGYSRSIFTASHSQQLNDWQVYGAFYQEKDNRNRPLSEQLSNEQKLLLSLAGEQEEGVLVPAIDSVGYSPDLLLYRRVDTLDAQGNKQVYYEFSNNPANAFYQLSFAEVGAGKGHYVLKEYIGLGKVYEYLPPLNGQPQGRFEPVRIISPPTQKSLFTAGTRWTPGEHQQAYAEFALSNNDSNLFSSLDGRDDKGSGLKTGYGVQGIPAAFNKAYKWEAAIDYEFITKNFAPIDRFRPIEFDRDWGLAPAFGHTYTKEAAGAADDHLLSLSGGLKKDAGNQLSYKIAGRRKGALVNGFQQEVVVARRLGLLQLEGRHFYLQNQQPQQDIRWHRWQTEAALHFDRWVPGYRYTSDRQATRQQDTDSLLYTLMNFDEHRLYILSGAAMKSKVAAEYSFREDRLPSGAEFERANLAHTASLSYATEAVRNQQIRMLSSYRHSTRFTDSLGAGAAENIVSSQLNWLGNFWKKTVRTELTYTLGSGRELRRDYVYVKVPVGEGTHTWRDDNGNGVQDLGEFYEAINPDERDYLRIFVPNNDFLLAFSSELNYRLNFMGVRDWYDAGGLPGILGRLSGNANWRSGKKTTEKDLSGRFLPFGGEISDESLLHSRQMLQVNLFYNRSNPRWGLDASLLSQERKQLLSAGFESDQRRQYTMGYRFNLRRSLGFRMQASQGRQANFSDFLRQQQYQIYSRELGPEISWMPSSGFQASLGSSYKQKENTLNPESASEAQLLDVKLNLRYSSPGNTMVQGNVRQVRIKFEGLPNSPAGYTMLEALQPGTNWVWDLSLQQRLLKGLQLNVSYEGRQSGEQAVVHLGRMSMQALF